MPIGQHEWCVAQLAATERVPGGWHDLVNVVEDGIYLDQALSYLGQRRETDRLIEYIREGANDRPVLAGIADRLGGASAKLHPALGVYISAVLFSVSGAGQDNVGSMCAGITVVALIDHECIAEVAVMNLIGSQQVDDFYLAATGTGEHVRDIAALRPRHKAKIQPPDTGGCGMQDVEAVPILPNRTDRLGQISCNA